MTPRETLSVETGQPPSPSPGIPAGPEESGLGEVCVCPTPVTRLTSILPWPAPYSTAGPGPPPPPGDGAAGCRRERRQERGRSQERRQPSSSSSEKQRFYSCDRFGGREPPQPKPSLSSHPTSPTAGQEPGPPRQVRGSREPSVLPPAPHSLGPREGVLSCPGSQARSCSWLPGLSILPGGALALLLPSAFFLSFPPEIGWAVLSSSLALCPAPSGTALPPSWGRALFIPPACAPWLPSVHPVL